MKTVDSFNNFLIIYLFLKFYLIYYKLFFLKKYFLNRKYACNY